ncbi:hypothetical protein ACFUJ0_00065 [Streptomyces sp. NPDC057242]|uniref:hypothetical protein n=1 Tax=unclassified Streptomyces TaxID=2593676 RepID=UPI003642F90E
MEHEEVKAALGGRWNGGGQRTVDGWRWTPYDDCHVSAVYDQGNHLVAVQVDATGGPFVRLDDVEPIGRAPSGLAPKFSASRPGGAPG